MGAQCFKSVEVIAKDDLEKLVPILLKEIKTKILPELINQLQYTEVRLNDISNNKIEMNL
jgi:hypothetical protein